LTEELSEALDSEIVIISILTQEANSLLKQISECGIGQQKFVFCMKGVEALTGKTLTQLAIDNGFAKENLALWVGPGHVQNFLDEISNCMLISAYDENLSVLLSEEFRTDLIRFYLSNDVLGVEIGSATKNIIGIMSGILDGLGWSSLKGALMTRATNEVSKLIKALGGDEKTVYGLSHLGDYEATLFSPFSHNRMFGEMLARGEKSEKSAEGVGNTKGISNLARQFNIEMPLTFALERILFENANIEDEIKALFNRPIRYEFE
jgi:glycerol-3-phosphate dehydrogenase (NAD(P)+)